MADDAIASLRDLQSKWGDSRRENADRRKVLEAAYDLVASLETPAENVKRLAYHWPLMFSVTRASIEMDLFNKLLAKNGTPKTTDELGQDIGADPRLLGKLLVLCCLESTATNIILERLLKHLVNGNIVAEEGPSMFKPNDTTRVYATPEASGVIVDMHDGFGMVLGGLPEWLKKNNYQNPMDDTNSLFKFSTGIDASFFGWLFKPENKTRQEAFHRHMAFMAQGPKWHETVPLDEILGSQDDLTSDAPLIVDLGGGTGHDLVGFSKSHPGRQGRLILQDQEPTIKGIDPETIAPVEAMAHDFFQPQPVQGAKAYFLKRTLHDWDDESSVQILRNVKAAMKPGYSKILINEVVVPDVRADWFSTGIDIVMMVAQSAMERKEREWRLLAQRSGLKVSHIWRCGDLAERLIEMVIA